MRPGTSDHLTSWHDTETRRAIVDFVGRVTEEGGAEMGGMLQAFAGQSVEEYSAAAEAFLRGGRHPTLGRTFHECGYEPMIDFLGFLEANGFTNYIASGGDRDFMRPVTEEIYGSPSERVIGSSNAPSYTDDEHGGTVFR